MSFVFRTGDQFNLRFVANIAGIIEAFTVVPDGSEVKLGNWTVPAATQVVLPTSGRFRFEGAAGQEELRLRLTPCAVDSNSRDLVAAAAGPEISQMIPECAVASQMAADIKTITSIDRSGSTHIGVLPVDNSEIQAGRLSTRQLSITLEHRGQ